MIGVWRDLRATVEQMEIKRMQRLANLEHDVIGYIHDIVDAANADFFQRPLEPLGAGRDPHSLNNPRRVPRA